LCFYLTLEVKTKRVIYIPKGSTSFIISYLDKKNYNLNYIDNMVVKVLGYPQSGWIDLKSTNMTKFEFLYKLTTSKAALKKVTLIPGETYFFFLQTLAKKLSLSTPKLFELYAQYAYKKDGNIIADTYYLPLGMKEKDVLFYLLNTSKNKYKKMSKKIFGTYNVKNWYRYVTIASIIQKESASKEEMSIVSSVIHNRIKKNMRLQMDGTLNYSKYSHTKVTPKMIREDTSEYNTYKNKGIPSNPVCAIEFEAIKAAIFPAKSNYLYFMKSKDGNKHNFSTSYKKHRQNINTVKRHKKITKSKPKKQKVHKTETKIIKKRNLKNLWN